MPTCQGEPQPFSISHYFPTAAIAKYRKLGCFKGFAGDSVVKKKNLPAKQETGVRSLGWENPLEKEMATHFSILAWKSPWTEVPGGLQSMGSQRVESDGRD